MKTSITSFLLVVAAAPALAADATGPAVDKLVACSGLTDSRQRLACFDREIVPLATPRTAAAPAPRAPVASQPASPAGVAAPVASAPVAAAPVAPPAPTRVTPSLGEEQLDAKLKPAAPAEEQALHARITALSRLGSSAYAVTLDNGQTWRHEDQHLGSYLRKGDAITISRAALGSYRLTRDAGDSKNWIRVARIR